MRIERTFYPRAGVGFLDVLAPGVDKAEALAFLQDRWGVSAAETLAIGDNWNDHEMLERAGLGLVMGNADPQMHALGLPCCRRTTRTAWPWRSSATCWAAHDGLTIKKGVISLTPFLTVAAAGDYFFFLAAFFFGAAFFAFFMGIV